MTRASRPAQPRHGGGGGRARAGGGQVAGGEVAKADAAPGGEPSAAGTGATAGSQTAGPAKSGQGGTWSDTPLDLPGDAETTQERVAALEHELHVSLATYDGALGAEQVRAKGGEGGLVNVEREPDKADKGVHGPVRRRVHGCERWQRTHRPGAGLEHDCYEHKRWWRRRRRAHARRDEQYGHSGGHTERAG